MNIESQFKYYSDSYVREYVTVTPLSDRNAFDDEVNIVIIGHLTHIDILIDFYRGIKNVLFVVDNTESLDKINRLKENGFEVLILNTPAFNGFGNVNFQAAASLLAAKHLHESNRKYCIRMRSDQIILQLHAFINNFKFDKLGVFSYVYQEVPHPGSYDFDLVNKILSEKYNVDLTQNNLCACYLMDYCISGPVKDMIEMFDYYESDTIVAPAEHKLLMTYLCRTKKYLDNSLEGIKKHFYFMLPTLVEHDINFLMIKQGYHDWTVAMPLQPWLYKY